MAKILVVAIFNQELDELASILRPEGHEVALVNNWTEAIEVLDFGRFDLVIFRWELGRPMFEAIQEKQAGIPSIILYKKGNRPEIHTANIALQWPGKPRELLAYVTATTRNLTI